MAEAGFVGLVSFCSHYPSITPLFLFGKLSSCSQCLLDDQEQDSSMQRREGGFSLVAAASGADLSRHLEIPWGFPVQLSGEVPVGRLLAPPRSGTAAG